MSMAHVLPPGLAPELHRIGQVEVTDFMSQILGTANRCPEGQTKIKIMRAGGGYVWGHQSRTLAKPDIYRSQMNETEGDIIRYELPPGAWLDASVAQKADSLVLHIRHTSGATARERVIMVRLADLFERCEKLTHKFLNKKSSFQAGNEPPVFYVPIPLEELKDIIWLDEERGLKNQMIDWN